MRIKQTIGSLLLVCVTVAAAIIVRTGAPPARAQSPTQSGIACTTSPTASFTLRATDGYIALPDGNTVYMWSFAASSGAFQYPGPVLCVEQGQTVTIVLNNELPDPVSLIFPGQEAVLANGVPSEPVFTGSTLNSLAPPATPGGSMTYTFIAGAPGTYLYESGTQPERQVQMGLAGALVIRPIGVPGQAYADADTAFNPQAEFVMLLSEIDPALHQAVERGYGFNMSNYTPRYWLINGRSFPDTIAPNYAAWLPDQPYGALAHILPYDATTNPLPALVRYLSVGTEDYPFHPHGNHSRVIARDASLLTGSAGEDLSFEKFSLPIGPGQTWDVLFTWRDADGWDADTNPVPIVIPQELNQQTGPYYSGSPYLGGQGTLPVGADNYNQCGEYYHVAHNHALHQITSWGLVMSGMLTYTRIDPPLPNSCP